MERWKLLLKGIPLAAVALLVCQAVAGASMFTIVSDIAQVDGFAPVFTQGGFAVPVELAAAFGAEVRADGEGYAITYQGATTSIRPGDERASTPAGERVLQPKPFIAADTLFVPLNFLADVLRLRVSWNPSSNFITLSRWASPLSAIASEPRAGAAAPSLGGQPFLFQTPAVPRPIAILEAPFVQEAALSGETEEEDRGLEEEPELAAGMWPSFFAATGVALERSMEAGLTVYEFQGESGLEATTAVLVDPFRLVVDLRGAAPAPGAAIDPLLIGEGGVRQLRASVIDHGVRVVFDMEMPLGHKLIGPGEGRVGIALLRPFLGISVDQEEYGGRVMIDAPAETPYEISRLVQPDRIVIDLYDATLVNGPISFEPGEGPVTRVRAAQFLPDVARVVLDVSEPLEIEPAGASAGLALVYGDAVAPISYRTAGALGIDLKINVGDDAQVRVSRLSGPDRLVVDVAPMTLDEPLEDVMILSGPVYRVRASQHAPDQVRIVADLRHYVQYALRRDDRHAIVSLRQPSLAGRTIAVDAGHGGIDVGAISANYGLTEKEVNLDISLRLRDLIVAAEGGVHLTRSDDVGLGINHRDGLMERVRHASGTGSDVFVSVHNNSALVPGPTARGTETFYRSDDPDSKALAESVQASVVSALGTVDRGVIDNRTRGYFVLRYIDRPAILVEVAFLSHPEEEELLMQDWFRQRAAEGIFNGLLKYFHPDDRVDDSSILWSSGEAWRRMPAREQQP